jgi:hypothetical protein
MRLLIILIFFFLCSHCVLSGTIDPTNQDLKYIEYGKQFHCVGKLCGKDLNDQYYCASGVAIEPKWIITAAHVVKDVRTCKISINNKEIKIKKIIPHKDFNYDNFGEYDIALCICDDDMELTSYPVLYADNDEIGKICSMSGYGLHGTFETGCNKSDNFKRAGLNIIDGLDKHVLICSASNKDKTELEFITASGDSGGGLFIDKKLAGINSCVMAADKKPDSSFGDESCHTRISIFRGWIQSVIREYKE